MAAGIIGKKRRLTANPRYRAEYRGPVPFSSLDPDARHRVITGLPEYGEVVCRCKTITRAEIVQALRNPLGVHTIIGVKNRVHATMGRCQGAYCLAKIMNIITDELKVPPEEISYRRYGDRPLAGRL